VKFITFIALFIFIQNTANAADFVKAGHLVLSDAWGRASTSIKRPSTVYLKIENTSSIGDQLISVHTPTAKRAELHNHFTEGGIVKMRQLKLIEIPPNKIILLKPSGFHIMLFELNTFLKTGEMFPINLTFKKAGEVSIKVQVADVGSVKSGKSSTKHAH